MTTNYNFVVRNGLVVRGADASTSTNTGAVVIAGGVGIGGSLYASQIYEGNARVLTTASVGAFGVSAIYAGTGTAISTSTGAVTIWVTGGGSGTQTLQDVTNYGSTTTNAITISNATLSTGTSSGALIVSGGVGVGGNLYVQQSAFINGSAVITTATLNNYVVQTTILAGTDTAVSTTTGVVSIWNTSNLQSVTNRGSVTSNNIEFSSTTASTSTNTGAIKIAGGVGIGGNLYVERDSYIGGAIILTSATINSYVVPSSTIFAGTDTAVSTSTGNVYIWNTSTLNSILSRGSTTTYSLSIANLTDASSTITGALIVSGGVGVGGNLYASALYDNGSRVVTENTIGGFGVSSISAGTGTAISTATGAVTVWNTDTLQSITNRGSTSTNAISITNTTQSSNTNSSQALIVSGGIGAQKVVASSIFDNGNRVVTSVIPTEGTGIGITNLVSSGTNVSFGISNFGVTALSAGSGIGLSGTTGSISISNFGVTSISGSGQIAVSANTGSIVISLTTTTTGTYQTFNISGTDDSISPVTGALTVVGGVGIGKSLTVGNTATVNGTFYRSGNITSPDWFIRGIAFVSSTATYTATTLSGIQGPIAINAFGVPTLSSTQSPVYSDAATIYVAGPPIAGSGVTITNPWSLYVANGNVKIAANSQSNSPGTGALVVSGGVGVGGNLNVSGTGSFDTNGITIGAALISSYASNTISSAGTHNLDVFSTSTYRTARYTIQIVDGTKIHVTEMTVFHNNTLVYKNEYGISTNTGELGTFDATLVSGTVTLTFTPNYTPSSMIIKATRTALTS